MTSVVVKGIKIKGGKVEPIKRAKSVSERIRQKKSKRVRVAKPTAERGK